jgi:hypothetical protein
MGQAGATPDPPSSEARGVRHLTVRLRSLLDGSRAARLYALPVYVHNAGLANEMSRRKAFVLSFWPLHFAGPDGPHAKRCSVVCPLVHALHNAVCVDGTSCTTHRPLEGV